MLPLWLAMTALKDTRHGAHDGIRTRDLVFTKDALYP